MAYANWDIYEAYFPPQFTRALTTVTGSPPLVGLSSLELAGNGETQEVSIGPFIGQYAVLDATVPNRLYARGRRRTLVRVLASTGPGRQQIGLACEGDSGVNKQYTGGYVLLLDGPQNLVAWERLVLGRIYANPSQDPADGLMTQALTVLAETPLTVPPTALAALELTWNLSSGGAWRGVRLTGKYGTQADYSDLSTVLTWGTTDFPAPVQSGTGRSGVLVRYNSTDTSHIIKVLVDQTNLDQIQVTTVGP